MSDIEDLIRVDEVYDMTEEDTKSKNIQEKLEFLTGNIVNHLVKNETFDLGDVVETIDKWEKEGFRGFNSEYWTKEGLSIALGFISSMEKTEHDIGNFADMINKLKKMKGFDDHLLELLKVSPPLNEIFYCNKQIVINNVDYILRFAIVFRIFKIFFNKFRMKMEEAKNYRLNFIELRDKVLDLVEENKILKDEIKILKDVSAEKEKLELKLSKQDDEIDRLKKELKEAKKSDVEKRQDVADEKTEEEPKIIIPQIIEEKKELTLEEIIAKGIKEGWVVIKGGVNQFRCFRCGYVWLPKNKKLDRVPKVCPECNARNWNKLKKQ
ncbi:MAG: hypothetical protein DRP06_01640 [Candidatus Aenigmatarchaeota archaeon]|nr:MAG: hypothetical protein DRP06_01640 [Candidatus Aenigmarchaeota archaeon]